MIASVLLLVSLTISAADDASAPSTAALPVKTVTFRSEALDRDMMYNIVLPQGYETSNRRYATIYLLHGLTSNYAAWALLGVPKYAPDYDLIFVMPDAGNSWYVNWSKDEDGQSNKFEDYMIKELIGHIDSTYRTIAKREARAINGLSMGGYGALTLGLRHPDLFGSIGSQSGALGFAKSVGDRLRAGEELPQRRPSNRNPNRPEVGPPGFRSQDERTPKGLIFQTGEECDAYDPFKLVLKVPREELPHISIDCGTEDRLMASNRDFLKVLLDNEIPCTFAESPGGHVPAYWAREVGHAIAVQNHILKRLMRQRITEVEGEGEPPANAAPPKAEPDAKAEAKVEVEKLIETQVKEWNAKNLDGFMETYWKSPQLVFLAGGDREEGWESVRDRYRKRYQGEGKEMGALTFSDLEIDVQTPSLALARGVWKLDLSDGKTPNGRFSLVLKRLDEGWKITQDHTSASAATN